MWFACRMYQTGKSIYFGIHFSLCNRVFQKYTNWQYIVINANFMFSDIFIFLLYLHHMILVDLNAKLDISGLQISLL